MATVKYQGADSVLFLNTNWRIMANKVDNREIYRNPDLHPSTHLNIDMELDGVGRVDLKIDESGCAHPFEFHLFGIKILMKIFRKFK